MRRLWNSTSRTKPSRSTATIKWITGKSGPGAGHNKIDPLTVIVGNMTELKNPAFRNRLSAIRQAEGCRGKPHAIGGAHERQPRAACGAADIGELKGDLARDLAGEDDYIRFAG